MERITQTGVYDLPFQDYLGQPADALSMGSSDAHLLVNSTPAHLRASWDEPDRGTSEANIGSVAHEMLLEPHHKRTRIAVVDANDWRTKVAQIQRDAAYNAGRIPILRRQYDDARRIVDAVMSHSVAAELLRQGDAEKSWFWKDPKTGLYRKCRPDFYNAQRIIIDLKTVGSAHKDFLQRRVHDGGWFMSAPWYCDVIERVDGAPASGYCWIVVEQKPPHAVVIRRPTDTMLMHGDRLNKQAWETFTRCASRNEWPAYGDEIEELSLPNYALYRLEEDAVREEDERKWRGMEAIRLAEETGGSPFA